MARGAWADARAGCKISPLGGGPDLAMASMLRPQMAVFRSIGLALFSTWVWVGSFLWMLIGALATIGLRLVGFPYQKVHGWVTAPLFVHVPRYIAMARLRVHYHPRFDAQRRSVFTQNHINLLDGHVASAAIPHAFSGLMNAWQFKIPIYGWLMTLSKGIPVHKRSRERIITDLSVAARARKEIGMSVLTFPEGHRSPDGRVHAYKRGVFMMARDAGMPIVPIAVAGMYELNRKGSLVFHPWRRVDVYVGPQHETEGLSDGEIGRLAERVRRATVHAITHGRWPDDWDAPQPMENA